MAVKLICLLCYQCVGGLLHELSNQGAQLQMNIFLEEKLLPQMVACSQVVNGSCYCYGVDDVVSFIETSLCSAFYGGCKRDTARICCWPLCCCMPCCWPPAMQQSIDIAYPQGTQQQTNRTRLQRSIDGTLCEWCQCFSGIWQTVTDEVSQKLPLLLQTIPLKQHTHTLLTVLCPRLPGWAGTRKVKPVWILLKQETVSGNGICWAICKSAPRSSQKTMPVPHHSVFYRLDALPAAQPTVSKHWRLVPLKQINMISRICQYVTETV